MKDDRQNVLGWNKNGDNFQIVCPNLSFLCSDLPSRLLMVFICNCFEIRFKQAYGIAIM